MDWWRQQGPRPPSLCCDVFWEAMQRGTDNESFGALVYFTDPAESLYEDGAGFRMGTSLPPIKLCPWCGGTPRAPETT